MKQESIAKPGVFCTIGTKQCKSSVRLGPHASAPFALEGDVRQGSVLSPTLLLILMDPLLKKRHFISMGISVNNLYAGVYLHAHDIRTLTNNLLSLEAQISTVTRFTITS